MFPFLGFACKFQELNAQFFSTYYLYLYVHIYVAILITIYLLEKNNEKRTKFNIYT